MGSPRKPGRPAYTYVVRKKYWRFRYRGFEAPLPDAPGDPAFEQKYAELLALVVRLHPDTVNPAHGTFDWVLRKFYKDQEFRSLSESTQRHYMQLGKAVSKYLGDFSMQLTTVKMLAEVRNDMKLGYAEVMRRFISRLYRFAGDREWVVDDYNPARRLRSIKRKRAGHEPWSDDEIRLLLEHATGPIRTLILLALCTGQRPGDVERMTWSQVLGDQVRVRQRKTNVMRVIPMHPVLRQELDRLRSEGPVAGVIVRKSSGRPLGIGGFGHLLKKLIASIPNMPHRTPHGSRYATAAILQECGCSVAQIMAIIGHTTFAMAVKYLTSRDLAMEAMGRVIDHAALPIARSNDARCDLIVVPPMHVLPPPPRIGRVSLARPRVGLVSLARSGGDAAAVA